MKVLSIGSEATVYASGSEVIKKRLKKKYRIDEIDDRLRAARTASEFRILSKAANTPLRHLWGVWSLGRSL